jgi:hypothetical protein
MVVHSCVGAPETGFGHVHASTCNEWYVHILTKNPEMIAQVPKENKGSILSPRSKEFSCFTAKVVITVRSFFAWL